MKAKKLLIRVRRRHFVLGVAMAAGLILWRAGRTIRGTVSFAPPGKAVRAPLGEWEDTIKKTRSWRLQPYRQDK